MTIPLPPVALVLLIGPSGVGKSTFARKHFRPTEVLSSDAFLEMVCDDEDNQRVGKHAFELLRLALTKRLLLGRLTVVDATNVKAASRRELLEIARSQSVPTVAVVFDLPASVPRERNRARSHRVVPDEAIDRHREQLANSLPTLAGEFARFHLLKSVEEMDGVTFMREGQMTTTDVRPGPFTIIGDVHGCIDELRELLAACGYTVTLDGGLYSISHSERRLPVFVGDLVDRGPDTPAVLKLVGDIVRAGSALCVCGNHDDKLLRKLNGRKVTVNHGLEQSLEQLAAQTPEFRAEAHDFLRSLPYQLVLDGGRLAVAHAGLREEFIGRTSDRVRSFALFGDTTGELDAAGLPVRRDWAVDYRGRAKIVYGHTPVAEPRWVNNTINIDTGCVFGGGLTALRYPEGDWTSVPAHGEYAVPRRPFQPEG